MTKFFLVGCDYWNTIEDGEEGFDYKWKMLVNETFDSYDEAKTYAVNHATENGWSIKFVGQNHIYKDDNVNDLADITIVENDSMSDMITDLKNWG